MSLDSDSPSTISSPDNDMSRRNLLLCFDAFGTLFHPRLPVAQQYADVARKHGLGGFSNDDVAASFKKAFKSEAKQNPNYGKANGLNPEKWWTNVSARDSAVERQSRT